MAIGSQTTQTIYLTASSGRLKYTEPRTHAKKEAKFVNGVYAGHTRKWDTGNEESHVDPHYVLEITVIDSGDGSDGSVSTIQKVQCTMPSTGVRMLAQGLKQIRAGTMIQIEVWPATKVKTVCLAAIKINRGGEWISLPDSGMPKIPEHASAAAKKEMTESNNRLAEEWIMKHPDYQRPEDDEDGDVITSPSGEVARSKYPIVHGFTFPPEKWPAQDSFGILAKTREKVWQGFMAIIEGKLPKGADIPVVAYLLDKYGKGRDLKAVDEMMVGETVIVGIFLKNADDNTVLELTGRAMRHRDQPRDDAYGAETAEDPLDKVFD